MITAQHIDRLIRADAFTRLIDRVLTNGRDEGINARERLARPGSEVASALGLALQRICELTYGPSREGASIAERLMQRQTEHGSFAADGSAATTAVAVRALLDWQTLRRTSGVREDPLLQTAISRALQALRASLDAPAHNAAPGKHPLPRPRGGEPSGPDPDGGGGAEPRGSLRTAGGPCGAHTDARDIEIVLWQLGSHPAFRAAVPVQALAARLTTAARVRDPLSRLALSAAA